MFTSMAGNTNIMRASLGSRIRDNFDILSGLVVVVGTAISGAVYIGELRQALASEREKRKTEVKAVRELLQAELGKERELREREVVKERGLRERDVKKERELRERDVKAVMLEAHLEMERRIADFMTKGDYSGVLEAIENSKRRREKVNGCFSGR